MCHLFGTATTGGDGGFFVGQNEEIWATPSWMRWPAVGRFAGGVSTGSSVSSFREAPVEAPDRRRRFRR